jgi:hypothetical protein
MSSNRHALWPWSPIVATLVLLNTVVPTQAFEDNWRDHRLETPMGMENTQDGERAIGFQRDENHRRLEANSIYGSSLSTALGNQINIEAGVGASVIVNANQVNKGHQLAVTVLATDPDEIVDEATEDFDKRQ